MDYMREMNAFYDWLETNTLSANAVLTWCALMHTNNKCFWKPEFQVSLSVLSHKTGGVSRRSIERARNELDTKGLIHWREQPGKQCALYRMISLVRRTDAQPDVQPVAQPDVQPVAITSYPSDTQKTKTKTNTRCAPPASPPVLTVGELGNVRLTQEELDRLRADYPDADEAIDWFSLYVADRGYKSKGKTHNLAIRRWVVTAYRENKDRSDKVRPPPREESDLYGGLQEYL